MTEEKIESIIIDAIKTQNVEQLVLRIASAEHEIKQKDQRIAALEAVLNPFAPFIKKALGDSEIASFETLRGYSEPGPFRIKMSQGYVGISQSDLRRAHAALNPEKSGE